MPLPKVKHVNTPFLSNFLLDNHLNNVIFISFFLDLYFVDEPTDADAIPGAEVQFHCKAKHLNQLIQDVQWLKNGQIVRTSARVRTKKGSLVIGNAAEEDVGRYECQVSAGGQTMVSRPGRLRMYRGRKLLIIA